MKLIALGCDCGVTFRLQEMNIKQENSIFEWWQSPLFSEVVDIFEKALKGLEFTIVDDILPGNHYHEGTAIRSSHYFGKTGETSVESILRRRAQRLRDYLSSDEKIIFIREEFQHDDPSVKFYKNSDLATIKKFKELIEAFNPRLNYALIILMNEALPYEKYNEDKVYQYSFDRSKYSEYIYNCFNEHPQGGKTIDDLTP